MGPDPDPGSDLLDVSVVIPVYNEEKNLDELYRQLDAALEPLPLSAEIIFVDDGSSDGSLEILRRVAGEDKGPG